MTQGGVPMVPNQRWVDEWPNVHPSKTTNKFFRRWAGATCLLGGFAFAKYFANEGTMRNEWYTRPDLKPYPAMVNNITTYEDDINQQML